MKPVNGTFGKIYHGGEWLGEFHSIDTTFETEPETYHWMTLKDVTTEEFEQTKKYDGRWVTVEFEGGKITSVSQMSEVEANRIIMQKHRVKIVIPEDGTQEIHLYKYKKG